MIFQPKSTVTSRYGGSMPRHHKTISITHESIFKYAKIVLSTTRSKCFTRFKIRSTQTFLYSCFLKMSLLSYNLHFVIIKILDKTPHVTIHINYVTARVYRYLKIFNNFTS